MKKTFQLRPEGKHPDRVLDATKHEIRKYLKRERRRDLPEGVDFWDFDCKFGLTQDSAEVVHLATLIERIVVGGGLSVGAKPSITSSYSSAPWRFWISFQCARVATVTKLNTSPFSPARPVLPMRWM